MEDFTPYVTARMKGYPHSLQLPLLQPYLKYDKRLAWARQIGRIGLVAFDDVEAWCSSIVGLTNRGRREALAYLLMFISWETCNNVT
jgi:hypothetical protein